MGWSGWVVGHLNAGLERRYFGEDTVLTSICSRVEFLGSRYLPFAGLSWVRGLCWKLFLPAAATILTIDLAVIFQFELLGKPFKLKKS